MENICKMDCHACTLQEGIENKALCATLLMPAMLNRLTQQLQRVEAAMVGKGATELNEVVLKDVKQINSKKDESVKNENN